MFLGKKAYEYFKREDLNMNTDNMTAFLNLNVDEVFTIGENVIADFLAGKYDEVRVVYNKFKNAATQIVTAEKILPVELEAFESTNEETSKYLSRFHF